MSKLCVIFLILVGFTSCANNNTSVHVDGDHVVVDGVTLKFRQTVNLRDVFTDERMILSTPSGDVGISGSDGEDYDLRITYYEHTEGDAQLFFEDGMLKIDTASGEPAMIGDIAGTVPKAVALELKSGYGDLVLSGMSGSPTLTMSTGSGDCRLTAINGAVAAWVKSGTGDIVADEVVAVEQLDLTSGSGSAMITGGSDVRKIEVTLGAGDLVIRDMECNDLHFRSGSGNLYINDSTVVSLEAYSGAGDLVLENSSVSHKKFISPSGDIIIKKKIH